MLFDILPSLNDGVLIHFHDVIYPFEYPQNWVYEGRAWNEAYAIRAFLQYNSAFQILLFQSFLRHFHGDKISETMPTCMTGLGGSIWLRKCYMPGE